MSHCQPGYLNSTFYSSDCAPYCLDNYQPGCGLRRRRSSQANYRNYQPRYETPCCQEASINFHKKCTCSLRIQPRCDCCCRMIPSLYHKLLSAPYTKICKKSEKKVKNRETQTEAEKQNFIRPSTPIRPPVTFNIPQPYYHPQPVYQPPIYQQPQQIYQPQPVYQQPPQVLQQSIPFVIRNSNVPRNQVSAISFKTIPPSTSQVQIKPPLSSSKKIRPSLVLQPQKINISIKNVKSSREEEKQPELPLKPTTSTYEAPELKSNQLSIIPTKVEQKPNQINIFGIQNQAFGSLRMSQGQTQLAFAQQQKSQQVNFRSQVTQSSKSQMKQSIQRFQQVQQKQITRQEQSNLENQQSEVEMQAISEEDD